MKKYIKPQSEFIEIEITTAVITDSLIVGDGGGDDGTVNPDGSEQLSNEYRGDWSNIWGNM